MKKTKMKYLLLPLLLLLPSCGKESLPSESGLNTGKSDNVSETTTEETIDVSLKLANVVDGAITDAAFAVDGTEAPHTFTDGSFLLKGLKLGNILTISHPRYQTKTVTITGSDLGTISLDYPYQEIGKIRYSSNYLANDWTLSSTRSLTSLCFRFTSPYDRFLSSDSVLKLYLNTGSTSSTFQRGDYEFRMTKDKLFVYDYGFVHDETDLSQFAFTTAVEEGKTTVELSVDYSYLKINSNAIVGVTMAEDLISSDIVNEMVFDEETIDSNNPKEFARIDQKGRVFGNTKNVDDPYWISKAMRASLIKGKDYSFASPKYCNHAADCDDIHFSVDYEEDALSFDFVGFGAFQSTEYIQLVLHNNIIDKNSWKLVSDDVVVHIYQDRVELYNNCSEFFAVQNGQGTLLRTIPLETYVDYGPYFTMKVSLPTASIPNISSVYDDLYLMAVEFNGKTLYDGKNYYENFFYQDVTRGDPADMISYVCLDAPKKRESNLTSEEKAKLTENKPISFANPIDVKKEKADDIYLSTERKETTLAFDIVGFGDFSATEIMTFVFHSSETDGQEWAIQESDTTIMVSQEKIQWVSGTTDFWVGTRITRGNASSAKPTYERKEGYFTINFEIPYSEISSSMTKTSTMRMYAFEFGFGGVIYNSEPWNKLMRYNGQPCGDPAFQVNYINI